ncbi:hypothetical protein M413DRAFT_69830 [Hebeloma cylindrosporum]|uniref:Sulfatase-modifying factor enzyme domain-containing protein n=1 Tax=Hebeloma cylindrosporum TaxID=76867 RepID=A0A0C2Y0A4_HEBCY|nr:hypothetical protein M413DRAFT_69830 [Hebeloma cylindrosporum h7]
MPAEIIDLHSRSNDGIVVSDIPDQIIAGLCKPFGRKHIPTMVLYDERGLRLYDDITTEAPEYYLFRAEEGILKTNADDIVQTMLHGSDVTTDEIVLELGAGALRKTSHILLGLSRLVGNVKPAPITYYALDLEQRELERALDEISGSDVDKCLCGKVDIKGLWGTYDDGLKFIESGGLLTQRLAENIISADRRTFVWYDVTPASAISSNSSLSDSSHFSNSDTPLSSTPSTPDKTRTPLHIMFLGSSLGNFSRIEAVSFLRALPLRPGTGDTLLVGLDHDNEKHLIEEAYNDPKGYTRRFIFNGLRVAGRALGDENIFDEDKWDYVNHYNVVGHHEAFYKSKCDQTILEPVTKRNITFLKDELVKIEESLKFSDADAYSMFTNGGLRTIQRWTDKNAQYSLWLLERPQFSFPLLSSPSTPIDTNLAGTCYSTTPFGVPSREEWRNQWAAWDFVTTRMIPPSMLFEKPINLRHICLFYLGHIPTFLDIQLSKLLQEPSTDPEEFRQIFERGIDPDVDDPTQCHPHSQVPADVNDWPSHATILMFQSAVRRRLMELYDDIDSGKPILDRKIGRVLFMTLEHEAMHLETLLYMLLHADSALPPPVFTAPSWTALAVSWNETPKPMSDTVTLGPALVTLGHDDNEADDDTSDDTRSHEFGWDNETKRQVLVGEFKIEWRPVTNHEFYQFYTGLGKGSVPLPESWVEEDGAMKVRTLYGPVSMDVAQHWPVIAPYNSLSTYASVKGGRLPTEPELRLFYDKFNAGYEGGANVGFRNWHPVPATTGGERGGGEGGNGGVWEWTSTGFSKEDGFAPSKLYPGYSMDFFDGKHQVVLGGSYATIPRISERRSFRNWYQRNYPYAWAGGRIVYDIQK